jgi:hypothetical protein
MVGGLCSHEADASPTTERKMTEREKELEDALVCLLVAIRHFDNGEDIDIVLSAQRTAENVGLEAAVDEEYAIQRPDEDDD